MRKVDPGDTTVADCGYSTYLTQNHIDYIRIGKAAFVTLYYPLALHTTVACMLQVCFLEVQQVHTKTLLGSSEHFVLQTIIIKPPSGTLSMLSWHIVLEI